MFPKHLFRRKFFTYTNELSYRIPNRKPAIVSLEEAVSCIKSEGNVYISSVVTTPEVLIQGMVDHVKSNNLRNITLHHMFTLGDAPYTKPEYKQHFRPNLLFIGDNLRISVSLGEADCISIHLQDTPKVFNNGVIKPDVSLIHVSPIDEHGFCSLGAGVDMTHAALMNSKKIVAQINRQMFRSFGDSIIHSSHFDYAIEIDKPLIEVDSPRLDQNERLVGKLVSENLVDDGSTLQIGYGKIPDAILENLTNHKDLGIHTEMLPSGILNLFEKGCITNSKKRNHRGKCVASFILGNKELYDFVDNNPVFELYSCDYTNSSRVISANPKVVAINACLEIDLTGQVCSDSLGTEFYSGFGGQVDFLRGAAEGFDGKGKPIIVLTSTTSRGLSKIVPTLRPGAGVVTSRAHVHYVVTEYGIASLFGKNMRQRAYELINIAHPDHREELERAAFERLKVMPSV